MTLAKGEMLSQYRLVEKIGEGGMGVVWKATDTTLDRTVAVKILPEVFSQDEERLARFEREAKLLASLNHPNIAVIHGLHHAEGMHFLAMELAPGEDLAQRIQRGAIPAEEAVAIAQQVAEALEAAHESGVIHRDLKPANIQLAPDGKVKVLDFGLAKAFESDSPSGSPSMSPTMTSAGTRVGMILGTAAYMSPEQARGRPVDKRADIWAFGCVFYEMLTGTQAFGGDTISDSLASVLKSEPDWTQLPQETPAVLRRLLRRCLAKDPKQRLRDMGEARIALAEPADHSAAEAGAPVAATAPGRTRERALWVGAVLIAAGIAGLVVWKLGMSERHPPLRKFRIMLPIDAGISPSTPLALSPDGNKLAYVGGGKLMVWELDQVEPRELPGGDGASQPFWSPDGKWLAYSAAGKLWRVAAAGGQSAAICALPGDYQGAAWGRDDSIVFVATRGPMFQVPAAGGDPKPILTPDPKTEVDFHKPAFLPDGKSIIYALHRREGVDTLEMLSGGKRKTLLRLEGQVRSNPQLVNNPQYSPTGHILFRREQGNEGIWALPFDASKMEVLGAPFLVAPNGQFPEVAADGTLVYVQGREVRPRQLVWVDRTGKILQTLGEPLRGMETPALSPDGKLAVLAAAVDGSTDLWLFDLARDTRRQLTFTPDDEAEPAWTPRGDRIFYTCGGAGGSSICERSADGTGEGRKWLVNASDPAISPDATFLVYSPSNRVERGLMMARLEDSPKPQAFVGGTFGAQTPRFSPDGHYVAYWSDEGGRLGIDVRSFPAGDEKWQVAPQADSPRWGPGGRELFYLLSSSRRTSLFSVPVEPGPPLAFGTPRELFSLDDINLVGWPVGFDVDPSGQRFLMVREPGAGPAQSALIVVQNWLAEFPEKP